MYYLGLDTMTSLYNKYLCDYYPITWLFYPSGCPRSRPVRNQVSVWEEATLCWGGDGGWGDWNKKVSFRIQSTGDLQLLHKVMVHQVLVYCIPCTYNCGCAVSTHLIAFLVLCTPEISVSKEQFTSCNLLRGPEDSLWEHQTTGSHEQGSVWSDLL